MPSDADYENRTKHPNKEVPMAPNVLLSINPAHADAILDGSKRWEYRKVAPDRGPPLRIVLYATAPVQAAVGVVWSYTAREGEVADLIEETAPHDAESVRDYFGDADRGTAISIASWRRFESPTSRRVLERAGIAPVQNFRYIGKVPAHEELVEPLKIGGDAPAQGFFCSNCYDTGIEDSWLDDYGNPHIGSWEGRACHVCDGDPLNAVPHERRPHPPDYDCPDCSEDTDTDTDLKEYE